MLERVFKLFWGKFMLTNILFFYNKTFSGFPPKYISK